MKVVIRGGQIFLHQARMFWQVLGIAGKWAFLASIALMVLHTYTFRKHELDKISGRELVSYVYVHIAESFDRTGLNPNSDSREITVNKRNRSEIYRIHDAVKDYDLRRNWHYTIRFIKSESIIFGFTCGGILILLMCFWSRFGIVKEEKPNQARILTPEFVAQYLKKHKLASWLRINDMPLVKDSETMHIMITGSTGTGKTTLFHNLLPQIRDKNHSAIVIDQTYEFVSKYWRPGDIVFNPTLGNVSWDFWSEIEDEQIFDSLADTLFCSNKNYDPMWGLAAKQLFIDSVSYLSSKPNRKISDIYNFFSENTSSQMYKYLKGTMSSKYLDPKNEKTGMSILTNLLAHVDWLKVMEEKDEKFTIRDFIGNDTGKWLFVTSTPKSRSTVQSIQSMLLDLAIIHLMELSPNIDRRFWFIVDELPSLKKLSALPKALSELRKYGGCVLTGLQNISQLDDIYGHDQSKTIFAQFGTKAFFRTSEPNTARMISSMFGETEYSMHNESISYGAHEMRDGVNMGKLHKTKPLLEISDLTSLPNLECFVSMPNPYVKLTKLKIG